MSEKNVLHEALNRLIPSQFEEVLFHYDIPTQNVPPGAQTERAITVIRYAESHSELPQLHQAITTVTGNDFITGAAPAPVAADIPTAPSATLPATENTSAQAISNTPEIFISYAWGGDNEAIVNQLDASLKERGITIIRDKRDLGYRGGIADFMRRIGRGHYVLVIISDKYLKSQNCMFELLEVAQHGDWRERVFPIVLADANIYKAINRIKYIKHWENEIAELDAAIKEVGAADLQGIREEIDLYTRIRAQISGLAEFFKDMNTLTPDMHAGDDFQVLYDTLTKQIKADQLPADNPN
ncbi:toll/interleukin-1 receptor domain-containing protein [Candidatus Venteria ishoeyi]|uniref:toll/interleukin-1 receptor domain-containing protein n=1 Tax=Candidatus Venteria ishoeyi TaxID=1899563 RepID=UPI0025A51917|nr:toll/interleukin-1 receptor domain-containing protein [Candidatus Venteria ishoeyi]MDM8547367.1 toll/interleukin-1 receptor domain-containing protein [Candidatus Venteria ishoeyi]